MKNAVDMVDWDAVRRLRNYGYECIAPEDGLGHCSYDENFPLTSPYGNPELALIWLGDQDKSVNELAEVSVNSLIYQDKLAIMRDLCSHLCDLDRILVVLAGRNLIQHDIGAILGTGQVTVSYRLTAIKTWIAHVLPYKAIIDGIEEPASWDRWPGCRAVWNAVVRCHGTTTDLAARMGRSRSTVYCWWQQALVSVLRTATPQQQEAVGYVRDAISKWQKPRPGLVKSHPTNQVTRQAMPETLHAL